MDNLDTTEPFSSVANEDTTTETEGDVDDGNLNEELCFVRRVLGDSQQQFANKLGVSKNAISMFETGRDKISLLTALKVNFLLTEYSKSPQQYNLRERQSRLLDESKQMFYIFCRKQLSIH